MDGEFEGFKLLLGAVSVVTIIKINAFVGTFLSVLRSIRSGEQTWSAGGGKRRKPPGLFFFNDNIYGLNLARSRLPLVWPPVKSEEVHAVRQRWCYRAPQGFICARGSFRIKAAPFVGARGLLVSCSECIFGVLHL